jgi:predicted ABC-type ATPase
MGGHGIPAKVIRRRYRAGLRNFFEIYRPLATTWRMYDNSRGPSANLIASGSGSTTVAVLDRVTWEHIRREVNHGA